MNITLTGEAAVAMKYAIMLARIRAPELDGLTDNEIISRLVEAGLEHGKEVPA